MDPDDFFGTGMLSRDPGNPLYRFHFVWLHQSHAARWEHFDEFRQAIESAVAKVVHVSSRTSQIEVANLEAANAIDGSVELRPPTSQ